MAGDAAEPTATPLKRDANAGDAGVSGPPFAAFALEFLARPEPARAAGTAGRLGADAGSCSAACQRTASFSSVTAGKAAEKSETGAGVATAAMVAAAILEPSAADCAALASCAACRRAAAGEVFSRCCTACWKSACGTCRAAGSAWCLREPLAVVGAWNAMTPDAAGLFARSKTRAAVSRALSA